MPAPLRLPSGSPGRRTHDRTIMPGVAPTPSLPGKTLASAVPSRPRCGPRMPFATDRRSVVGARSRPSNSCPAPRPGHVARHPAAGDRATKDQGDRAGAVIGAPGPVHPGGAAEFGHHQHRRLRPGWAKCGLQRHQSGVELLQRPDQPVDLRRVGVPAADLQRCDARTIRCPQHIPGGACEGRRTRRAPSAPAGRR